MTCVRVGNAIVCGIPDTFVSLEKYGAKVWCEMHSYFGPSFYRSERAITPIQTPSINVRPPLVEALRQHLSEAQKDAARYRWLCAQNETLEHDAFVVLSKDSAG